MEFLPVASANAQQVAWAYFGRARLNNKARTRRLVDCARRILQHPHGTPPQKMGSDAALQGLYGLLACPWVTHASVLQSPGEHTRQRLAQHPRVLLVHDSTELDYSHVAALAAGLGQIGNGSRQGYICHNSLALTPERQVLGLACQILHQRRPVPKGERPQAKRQHPQREGRLWVRAVQQIGPAPAGTQVVDVSDRGSDTYEYMEYEILHGRSFVLRSARDRGLNNDPQGQEHFGSDRLHQKLHAYARDLPTLGCRPVSVAAVPGQRAARSAQVRVAAGPVRLAAPHFARGQTQEPYLQVWGVQVKEEHPPAGLEPLEWILLTNLPTDDFEQASERIDWYACRPVIEDYHKGLKSGCGIEQVQFETPEHREPYIALLSVATALLLELREAARDPVAAEQPATEHLPPWYVQVLSQHRYRDQRPLSVGDFHRALAELGGYLPRKGRPPGWQTLWRGWSRLQDMVRGAELASELRKPPPKT